MEVFKMRNKVIRTGDSVTMVVVAAAMFFILLGGIFISKKSDIGPCTEYQCDVKNLRLSTTIEIDKEDEYFAKVKGNILRFVTDPLTMYDAEEKKIAYAGDAYHFIAQDSHSIYLDDGLSVEMVGLVNFIGDSYDIYNGDSEKIANVTFNFFNTKGEMYDVNGTLIADFHSKILFKDFDVRISEDCTLDEKTVLMIFCSYYSDRAADSAASSSSSSNNN